MTALQTSIGAVRGSLPGQIYSGVNATTTRSAAWQGSASNKLIGSFVARGDSGQECKTFTTTDTSYHVMGVVANDKLHQNSISTAPGDGEVIIETNDMVEVMMEGGIYVRTVGAVTFASTSLYISTQPDATNGFLTATSQTGDIKVLDPNRWHPLNFSLF